MAYKQSPKPNARLLKISWTFFGAGACCVIGALWGWEAVHNDEKVADWGTFFATLLALLLPPLGLFFRNLAHNRWRRVQSGGAGPGNRDVGADSLSQLGGASPGVYLGNDGVSGGDGMSDVD